MGRWVRYGINWKLEIVATFFKNDVSKCIENKRDVVEAMNVKGSKKELVTDQAKLSYNREQRLHLGTIHVLPTPNTSACTTASLPSESDTLLLPAPEEPPVRDLMDALWKFVTWWDGYWWNLYRVPRYQPTTYNS